jgi:hypothetical protein
MRLEACESREKYGFVIEGERVHTGAHGLEGLRKVVVMLVTGRL